MTSSARRPALPRVIKPSLGLQRAMREVGTTQTLPQGSYIFLEGDQSDSLILITSGSVEMFGSDLQEERSNTFHLGAGDLLGEDVIRGGASSHRPCFAMTLAPTEIIRVSIPALAGLTRSFERELHSLYQASSLKAISLAPPGELIDILREAAPEGRDLEYEVFHDGECLFREGDPSGAAYVTLTGSIRIYRETDRSDDGMLARLQPGQLFGEAGIDGETRRKASAAAECTSCVLKIPTHCLLRLLERSPALQDYITKQKTYYARSHTGWLAGSPLSRLNLTSRLVLAGGVSAMTIAAMTGPTMYEAISSRQIETAKTHLQVEMAEDRNDILRYLAEVDSAAANLEQIVMERLEVEEELQMSYSPARTTFFIPPPSDYRLPLPEDLQAMILEQAKTQTPMSKVVQGEGWGPSLVDMRPLQHEGEFAGTIVNHVDFGALAAKPRLAITVGGLHSAGSSFEADYATLSRIAEEGQPTKLEKHHYIAQSDDFDINGLPVKLTRWANADHIAASLEELIALITKIIGLAALGGALVGYLLSHWITRPVQDLTHAIARLSNGQRSVVVPHLQRTDTLGRMAQAIQSVQTSFRKQERVMTDRALEQQKKIERQERVRRQIAEFEQRFEAIIDEFMTHVESVNTVSETLLHGASQAFAGVDGITTSFGVTQDLVGKVQSQGVTMREGNRIIEAKTDAAQSSLEQVVSRTQSAEESLEHLLDGVRKVGSFVGTINAIAHKTRILALNATIEAAKAGISGNGFAVVAQEVESLSKQTSSATAEIDAKIRAIEESSGSVESKLAQISALVSRLHEEQGIVRSSIHSQTGAIEAITADVNETFEHTKIVVQNLTAIKSQVAASEDGARDLTLNAGHLKHKSEQLCADIEKFLASVSE
jgi:methyl-accepting chemotaxis protein/CRP-like cAMP-binding protein